MTSRLARVATERPFYALHAAAYDALISDPVEPWVDAIDQELRKARLAPARVLDAGCGTGRQAKALSERGHSVTLIDASAQLLAIARTRCPESPAYQGDICAPAIADTFEAVTCRGVLNDIVDDQGRDAALNAFARLLERGALLVLDVRDADRSRRRADGQPRRTEANLKSGGHLVFTSSPSWHAGRILVEERYELIGTDGVRSVHSYAFEMRPWTSTELGTRLERAGFDRVFIRPGVGRRTRDRLFVTARR